jgi:hypothetical protein
MGSMLGGLMGGGSSGGFLGGLLGGGGGGVATGATSGDPGGELTAGGGASSGDPGGELNAGGGAAPGSGGGGGGILNTIQGVLKSAGGKGNSAQASAAPSPSAASDIQIKALRNIVGLVSSAFSSKQSANRLQLANQLVSEGNS